MLSIMVNFIFFSKNVGISFIRCCNKRIVNNKTERPIAKLNQAEASSIYDEENKIQNISDKRKN
jgi:hypothetical protein